MKDIIGAIIITAIVLFVCALIFEAVWNSNLPMWLKWFLLK